MNATTTQRKQMIFRFDESFVSKLKYYAQREDMSLNSYVESILKSDIEHKESLPKLVIWPARSHGKIWKMMTGLLICLGNEKDIPGH